MLKGLGGSTHKQVPLIINSYWRYEVPSDQSDVLGHPHWLSVGTRQGLIHQGTKVTGRLSWGELYNHTDGELLLW